MADAVHQANSRKIRFDVSRLFSAMNEGDVQLLLISSRHNTRYVTGGYYYPLYVWDGHTRRTQHLSLIGIPAGKIEKSFFIGRPGESAVVRDSDVWIETCVEAESIGSLSTIDRAVTFLREQGITSGRVAVEISAFPADAFDALRHALPDIDFVEAVEILDHLRAVKSEAEINLMRAGTLRLLDVVRDVLATGTDGETTREIDRRVRELCNSHGLHSLYSLVCAGPGYFRAPSPRQKWSTGQILHIDTGSLIGGYVVEICRMGSLGEPSALARDLFDSCAEMEAAVLPELRSGVRAETVKAAAGAFLDGHRFGRYGNFVAHGIGMVHHEDPVIDSTSTQVLEAGMVVSIELEYRHPDVGHVKVEDMVVVRDSGGEVISPDGFVWQTSGR